MKCLGLGIPKCISYPLTIDHLAPLSKKKKNLPECSAQRFYNVIVEFNDQKHMQSALHFTVCGLLYILFLTLLSDMYYAKFISLLNLNCV